MGCGIHAILQKKSDSQNWETVLVDVLQLCSSLARDLNNVLQDEATSGLPPDLKVNTSNEISFENDTFWMGDHGHHYLTLEEFCAIDKDPPKGFQCYQDNSDDSWHIVLGSKDPWDIDNTIYDLQIAFRNMFRDLDNYRLVIGFDS